MTLNEHRLQASPARLRIAVGVPLLGACLILAQARAAFPLVVDDADVKAPREIETVVAWGMQHESLLDTHTATWSFTAGLFPRIEVSIDGGYGWRKSQTNASSNGLLDLNTGLKAKLVGHEGEPLSVTLAGTIKHPVALVRRGMGSGKRDFTINAACTRSFGALSLDGNAGYSWIGRPAGTTASLDQAHLGVALRWDRTSRCMLFIESVVTASAAQHWSDDHFLLRAGGQYALTPQWLLGVAVGRQLHGIPTATVFELGLTAVR